MGWYKVVGRDSIKVTREFQASLSNSPSVFPF